MKKILLTLTFALFTFFSFAQVRLNEFYVKPVENDDTNREFFELAVSPISTQTIDNDNTDDYVMVTYFENASEKGFYVFDLPDYQLYPGTIFVGASGNPFYYQSGTSTADAQLNWNNLGNPAVAHASVKKYVLNGSSYDIVPLDASFNNIFSMPNGDLTVLLFKKSGSDVLLEDGFIASTASDHFKIQPYIASMPDLNITYEGSLGSSSMNIHFSNYQSVVLGAYPNADPENDGYFYCSAWEKAVSPPPPCLSGMTPDYPNASEQGEPLYADVECSDGGNYASVTLTSGVVSPYPITVSLYADINLNGKYEPGIDVKRSEAKITIKGAEYQMAKDPSDILMFLILDGAADCFDAIQFVPCAENIVAPVSLTTFTANRNESKVQLNWATASESNNRGFYLQRKNNSTGLWDAVAFMPSKAADGNSNTALNYAFVDDNNNSGLTQYRLLQVDIDGKSKYSEILTVRGLQQSGKTVVYPNPSNNGTVTVVFEDAAAQRNIMISDMNGRMIKQFKNVTNNSVQIDNLNSGLYTIRIINIQNGLQEVQKVVVSK